MNLLVMKPFLDIRMSWHLQSGFALSHSDRTLRNIDTLVMGWFVDWRSQDTLISFVSLAGSLLRGHGHGYVNKCPEIHSLSEPANESRSSTRSDRLHHLWDFVCSTNFGLEAKKLFLSFKCLTNSRELSSGNLRSFKRWLSLHWSFGFDRGFAGVYINTRSLSTNTSICKFNSVFFLHSVHQFPKWSSPPTCSCSARP